MASSCFPAASAATTLLQQLSGEQPCGPVRSTFQVPPAPLGAFDRGFQGVSVPVTRQVEVHTCPTQVGYVIRCSQRVLEYAEERLNVRASLRWQGRCRRIIQDMRGKAVPQP